MRSRDCRHCGEAIPYRKRSGYCPDCQHRYCRYCWKPLAESRISSSYRAYCLSCSRSMTAAQKQRIQSDPDAACHMCGERLGDGRATQRCRRCNQIVYEHRRQQLIRQGSRNCQECGRPMPVGRFDPRCTPCQRSHQATLPGCRRPCTVCGKRLRKVRSPYCQPCGVFYQRWSKAYAKGDPAARLLRRKRQRRIWEQEVSC